MLDFFFFARPSAISFECKPPVLTCIAWIRLGMRGWSHSSRGRDFFNCLSKDRASIWNFWQAPLFISYGSTPWGFLSVQFWWSRLISYQQWSLQGSKKDCAMPKLVSFRELHVIQIFWSEKFHKTQETQYSTSSKRNLQLKLMVPLSVETTMVGFFSFKYKLNNCQVKLLWYDCNLT